MLDSAAQTISGTASTPHEMLFVASNVPESGILLAGLAPHVEVVRLADGRGVEQITGALAGRTGITALHILGHGEAGRIDLGGSALTSANIDAAAPDLASWGRALSRDADILLYGCNVAASADGRALVGRLAQLTGADVAASTDPTGAGALGANWALEVQTGAIETPLPFADQALAAWQHTLHHFRYGTMSWEPVPGSPNSIIVNGQVGWTSTHGHIPQSTPIGGIVANAVLLQFGDGTSQNVSVRVVSRDTATDDVLTEFVSDLDGNGTIDAAEAGIRHNYASAGAYTISWDSSARTTAINTDAGAWQQTMQANVGSGGNASPVIATPAVVQVADNTTFTYQIAASDPDGNTLRFRYGTQDEFYNNGVMTEATKPTGLTLAANGTITWDVHDGVLSTGTGDRWQVTVIAEDLDGAGNVLSSVPVDFVLKIVAAGSQAPVFDQIPSVPQQALSGQTSTFQVVMDDPDSTAAPTVSVLNPPSADPTIFSAVSTTDASGKTTLAISFRPTPDMEGRSFILNIRGRDGTGLTSDQSVTFVVPDTTPPAVPSALALTPASDTGISSTDRITADATPTVTGTTEAGATVTVAVDGTVLGTATAGGNGAWSYTVAAPLQGGARVFTATAQDAAGNVSAASATLPVTIDTSAPAAPTTLALAGAGAGGARPTVTGTAEAGSTVAVMADSIAAGTAAADGNGAWSFSFGAPLATGMHAITAAATDAAGNASGASAPLPFNVNDAPTGAVLIAGTPEQGAILTASNTLADTDGMGAVTYQWERDDGQGGWTSIVGATGVSHTLGQDDVGRTLRAVASYTDGQGTAERVVSAPTAGSVSNLNDLPAGAVSITGTPEQGAMLTASNTLADPDGMGPVTYQWERDDGQGGWVSIAGATGVTHTLGQDDVGRTLRAVASYTDGQGTAEQAASLPTSGPVANVNDAPAGAVTIAGTPEQGSALTASDTLTDPDGMGPVTYQWQRDDGQGGWVSIAGASGAGYTPGQDDVGRTLRAVASYTDGQGTAEQVASAPTSGPVANVNDAPAGAVAVAGTGMRGEVLTASDTLADPDGMGLVTYQWERDDGQGGWTSIAGATGANHTLERDDVGRSLRAVASYTDGQGTAERVASGQTSVVAPRPIPVPDPVARVSRAETMASSELAARLADGDVLARPAGTDELVLTDGTLSFGPATDASFLTRMYGGALGRTGETGGMTYWNHDLDRKLDKASVARGFLDSPEYQAKYGAQTDQQFVADLYRGLLQRDADSAGQGFWEQQIAQGASREQVLVSFADSVEAQAAWKGVTDQGVFVPDENVTLIRATYFAAFDRDADASGIAFHSGGFDRGQTVAQFGDYIEASDEFQALYRNVGDQDFVQSLYQNALGRAPDAREAAQYAQPLAAHSLDRGDVVMQFALSPEGKGRLDWAL